MAWTGQHQCLYPSWKILPIRILYCPITNWVRRFWREDNNVVFTNVQVACRRVCSQTLFLSIWAVGAMHKRQQQQQQQQQHICALRGRHSCPISTSHSIWPIRASAPPNAVSDTHLLVKLESANKMQKAVFCRILRVAPSTTHFLTHVVQNPVDSISFLSSWLFIRNWWRNVAFVSYDFAERK